MAPIVMVPDGQGPGQPPAAPAPAAAMAADRAGVMRRFVLTWLAALAVMIAALAGFCALVDPYRVLGTPAMAGLTEDKPAAASWPRVTKAYAVCRQPITTLLLGGSNVDVGLNPHSEAWPDGMRPVFNLAIDGGTPYTNLRFLQHALTCQHPARIIYGVSFIDTLIFAPRGGSSVVPPQFDFEARLRAGRDGRPNPALWQARIADLTFALLSLDALQDSITTLFDQHDAGSAYEDASGWNTGGMMRRWSYSDGFGGLFANKNAAKLAQLRNWRADRRQDTSEVAEIARLARERGIPLTVVILPNHVDLLEGIRQLGLARDEAAWQARLVRDVAGAAPYGSVPVWDFSFINRFTTEPVPAVGDHHTRMQWFYEPVHFQPALGDALIARVLGAASPADFGQRLTPDTVDAALAARQAELAAWEAGHPRDVARIAALLASLPP